MRNLVMVVVLVSIPMRVRAQTAPSKTLERAIKLYDQEDYYSASIELKKVTDGETGDDPANVQRAEFFQAKTIYQLGWSAASLAWFERIEADPAHPYHDATLKWLLALARQLPAGSGILELIAQYEPDSAAAVELGELRDEYLVLYGKALLARGAFEEARDLLATVPDGSPLRPSAQHTLGLVLFRMVDVQGGIHAMVAAAQDPAFAPLAVHDLAFWSRLLGDPGAAADALRTLADGDGPAAAAAALAQSRLAADPAELRGLTDTFDALALVTLCARTSDDLVADARPLASLVATRMHELDLGHFDDNAEMFAAFEQLLSEDTPAGEVIRLALGAAEPLHWQAELAREQAVFAHADKAYLTTAIASDISIELELRAALATADAGRWLRDRFAPIYGELARFEDSHEKVRGIVVLPALCEAAGLPFHAAAAPTMQPVPPPVAKKGGCAGCATTDPGPGALLLVALVALRRGVRRRLTPARQLE